MRFKPRYSLLTLLLLTAIVAGGVKLWRGPHRAVMSDPPTAAEEALLQSIEELHYWPITYEYEYVNEWNSRKYLVVKAFESGNRPIPIVSFNHPFYGELYSRHRAEWNPEYKQSEASWAKAEHVVCWLYDLRRQEGESWRSDFKLRIVNDGQVKDIYFLTSRKRIMECYQRPDGSQFLHRIELSNIADPEFRARVAEELAQIPDPIEPK